MFLWHFPSPRDARPLAGTLPCGVRTFLSRRNGSGHPARWHTQYTPSALGAGCQRASSQRDRVVASTTYAPRRHVAQAASAARSNAGCRPRLPSSCARRSLRGTLALRWRCGRSAAALRRLRARPPAPGARPRRRRSASCIFSFVMRPRAAGVDVALQLAVERLAGARAGAPARAARPAPPRHRRRCARRRRVLVELSTQRCPHLRPRAPRRGACGSRRRSGSCATRTGSSGRSSTTRLAALPLPRLLAADADQLVAAVAAVRDARTAGTATRRAARSSCAAR